MYSTREIMNGKQQTAVGKSSNPNCSQLPYLCFIISFEWFLISYKFGSKAHLFHSISVSDRAAIPQINVWFHFQYLREHRVNTRLRQANRFIVPCSNLFIFSNVIPYR